MTRPNDPDAPDSPPGPRPHFLSGHGHRVMARLPVADRQPLGDDPIKDRLRSLQAVLLATAEETAVAKREARTLREQNADLVLRLAEREHGMKPRGA